MYDIRQGQPGRGNPPWLPVFLWVRIRAGTGACPYDDNDAVDVIGHNNEFINLDTYIMTWNFVPHCLNHFAGFV